MYHPGYTIGPYTLIRQIGKGSFAVVWLAERRGALATTQFALKIPKEEYLDLEAIKQEAAVWLAASGHSNVGRLFEAEVYDGQHIVIVSEYAPDGSLKDWLARHGGKAPVKALNKWIYGQPASSFINSSPAIYRFVETMLIR